MISCVYWALVMLPGGALMLAGHGVCFTFMTLVTIEAQPGFLPGRFLSPAIGTSVLASMLVVLTVEQF